MNNCKRIIKRVLSMILVLAMVFTSLTSIGAIQTSNAADVSYKCGCGYLTTISIKKEISI